MGHPVLDSIKTESIDASRKLTNPFRRRSTWNEPFRGRTDESDSDSEGEIEVFHTRNTRTRNQSSSGALQGSEARSLRSGALR